MKKYLKEILILLIQLFMFYVFPLFAGPTDVMGMIVLLILATLLLSILIGGISNLKVKYLYPIIIAITFVPSVFIYYNETALIHSLWYLAVSSFGLIIGMVIHKLILKKVERAKLSKATQSKRLDSLYLCFLKLKLNICLSQ